MSDFKISKDLFNDVYRLVLLLDGLIDDPVLEEIRRRVEAGIQEKVDARIRRQAFTDYKTAQRGSAERENARKKYLDDAGIHKDWRSEKESEI